MRGHQRLVVTMVVLGLAGGLSACAEETTQSNDAAAPSATTATVTAAASAPAPSESSKTTADSPPPPQAAEGIQVPDVVGEDHQFAQDAMQAAGLYNLAEVDATGQGRLLLWDRNWVVVAQSPTPGSVSEDTTIVLRSKHDEE